MRGRLKAFKGHGGRNRYLRIGHFGCVEPQYHESRLPTRGSDEFECVATCGKGSLVPAPLYLSERVIQISLASIRTDQTRSIVSA